ncbi:MAG: lamin tail domain-containing protein [Myxococcota bacterium]
MKKKIITVSAWTAFLALAAGCADMPQAPDMTDESADGGMAGDATDPPLVPEIRPVAGDGGCRTDDGGRPADAGEPPVDGDVETDGGAPRATVRLSEVDYDQEGRDVADFLELRHEDGEAVSLDGWRVVLVNGADGEPYAEIALEGRFEPGGFAVVGPEDLDVPSSALHFPASGSFLQNGPDGMALLDAEGRVVDTLAYEGQVDWATAPGAVPDASSPIALELLPVEDEGPGSLARSQGAEGPWQWTETPTPGAESRE